MPDFLQQRLAKLHATGTYRVLSGSVEGVDFWSNDYLGLARQQPPAPPSEPQTSQRTNRLKDEGSGATGSRLISGDADSCQETERMIATFHGFPAALVFNSGYTANLGLLSAILKRGDVLLYDELMHASCRDGIRLGQARAFKFPHNRLQEGLHRVANSIPRSGQLFVLTEGRFSMDGDLAPLAEMVALCKAHGAHLMVDEAHSGGLEGPQGSGLVAHLGLQEEVFATIMTYGKAFGSHGAAVLGTTALSTYLINTCRPFIYTTGPAPAQWAGIRQAYHKLEAFHHLTYPALAARIAQFREGLRAGRLGKSLAETNGPIQIVYLPGNEEVMRAEEMCKVKGLLVKGIRSPTVPSGQERLRICLHAFNTEDEVAALVNVLEQVIVAR